MDGKQYIYSVQLGLTYKATDWLSVFAGGRMNYFTGGYQGALNASAATNLPLPTGVYDNYRNRTYRHRFGLQPDRMGIYSGYRFGCQVGQAEHWRKV